MRWLRWSLAVIALALLAACSKTPLTPTETVGLYLKGMTGRDPMRVLSLLTDEFHRRHRMVFANTADLPDDVVLVEAPESLPEDPEYAAERGRLGWLVAPAHIGIVYLMFPRLREIQLGWLESKLQGNRADVGLRAWVPDEATVDFTFRLKRRGETEPWRIDAVDVKSDSSANARFISYLIAPDLEAVQFIRQEAEARSSRGAIGPSEPKS